MTSGSVVKYLVSFAIVAFLTSEGVAQPSLQVRQATLRSVVQVIARGCPEGGGRIGSGFAFADPSQVITAHHVVGGCTDVEVEYHGAPANTSRVRKASITRVLPARDLALLSVSGAPNVPALALAQPPPDRNKSYSGVGFQNNQPTPDDIIVTFSPGPDRLQDIIPLELETQLRQTQNRIDRSQRVLRFNLPLQPGMSGGPIIDENGRVIGVVAGGLKAGAAPASWGWPSEFINDLASSGATSNTPVQGASLFYSQQEVQDRGRALRQNRTIRCGTIDFVYIGELGLRDITRTADDRLRVEHIIRVSTLPLAIVEALRFDVWTSLQSGATAVAPAGSNIRVEGNACVYRSSNNNFKTLIWATQAPTPQDAQNLSVQFENIFQPSFLEPIMPNVPWQYDQALTTFGAQTLPNGLVFARKGAMYPRANQQPGMFAHYFETLAARNGVFLGVLTGNSLHPNNFPYCQMYGSQSPGCQSIPSYLREWTHFVLATQLSTFPAN